MNGQAGAGPRGQGGGDKASRPDRRGLVLLHTGAGKGKTTAALGLAMRAAGHGMRVLLRQFIKGGWTPGEAKALARFDDCIDHRAVGRGFVRPKALAPEALARERTAAAEAFAAASAEAKASDADLVIFDEALYLVDFGLLDEARILAFLAERPPQRHVVLTGRGATPALIEAADLVTEMTCIKHPYDAGIPAQPGIEF
ncbi:MAG: cob(I)yrinic acid a,c-diamide adenosyltransferase [Planctomycetota bacterium]